LQAALGQNPKFPSGCLQSAPFWRAPTYYETQQKADEVIRRQFERSEREYGGDSTRPAVDVPYFPFFPDTMPVQGWFMGL
jgi:hypothetical protein